MTCLEHYVYLLNFVNCTRSYKNSTIQNNNHNNRDDGSDQRSIKSLNY